MNGRPISGASVGARAAGARRGRTGLTALASLVCGTLLLTATACGGGGTSGPGTGGGKGAGAGKPSAAVVTIAPGNGARAVDTAGALRVTSVQGRLTEVRVEDGKGRAVAGAISGAGTSWTPAAPLATATTYRVHAVAKDSAGRAATRDSSFTTLTPKSTFVGVYQPDDGTTVGVGMPFSVRFSRGITHPADVEKAIAVTTRPAVEVRGHWFGNDRLDFRPEHYWKPGTEVTVKLALDGVEGRPGVYGKQTRTVRFTIGRSQVSTVDAKTHTMTVRRDGKVVRTLGITTGKPGYDTWNGQMVISERLAVTRMNGETVGYGGEYDIKDVPHAQRLTDSGTFIHGNYWGGDAFGNYNASHGCVGLRDVRGGSDPSAPAAWFYDHSMTGDVVVVKNSHERTVDPGNGLNGWNLPWADWSK